mmetsp:Transcript_93708/g.264500  ORF Transcript_93708/g.264500 Transcript_93708/m.264500 type:complete len:243 (+) Transcript_93708:1544-2272(+)
MKHPLTGYCSMSSPFMMTCSYQPGVSSIFLICTPPPFAGCFTKAVSAAAPFLAFSAFSFLGSSCFFSALAGCAAFAGAGVAVGVSAALPAFSSVSLATSCLMSACSLTCLPLMPSDFNLAFKSRISSPTALIAASSTAPPEETGAGAGFCAGAAADGAVAAALPESFAFLGAASAFVVGADGAVFNPAKASAMNLNGSSGLSCASCSTTSANFSSTLCFRKYSRSSVFSGFLFAAKSPMVTK